MQTNQSKFPIGWIFAAIAALVMAVLIFFSFDFLSLGQNKAFSVIFAALMMGVMLVVVFLLGREKIVSIPLNFRKAAIKEALLLVVFVFIAFVTAIGTNHFYIVMGRKDVIQQEVKRQIDQIDDMFKSYNANVADRVTAYDKELESIEKNKRNDIAAYENAGLNQYTREALVVNFKADIACDDMQEEINAWKNDMLSKTTGLGLIRLMPRVNEIKKSLEDTLAELKKRDRKSEFGLNGDYWDYTLETNEDILHLFERKEDDGVSIWAFIVAIIAALIMLLPYIAKDRDGRNRGLFWELTHNREGASNSNGSAITGI